MSKPTISNRSRTIFSDSPWYFDVRLAADKLKNVVPHSVATAFASSVLPVPGGPTIMIPCTNQNNAPDNQLIGLIQQKLAFRLTAMCTLFYNDDDHSSATFTNYIILSTYLLCGVVCNLTLFLDWISKFINFCRLYLERTWALLVYSDFDFIVFLLIFLL